jgi:hypothetical protein
MLSSAHKRAGKRKAEAQKNEMKVRPKCFFCKKFLQRFANERTLPKTGFRGKVSSVFISAGQFVCISKLTIISRKVSIFFVGSDVGGNSLFLNYV